jgi:hypoxanthine phosphoribosyltransferase
MKKVYVTFEHAQQMVGDILRQIQVDNWRPDVIVGITRGGLTPAVLISQYLKVPMYTLDVRLRDDFGGIGPESNAWLAEWAFGVVPEGSYSTSRYEPKYRKNILIVDDINDSGATINWIVNDWPNGCFPNEKEVWDGLVWGGSTRFAVLYDNEASDAVITPTYSAQTINKFNDPSWIVFPWEEWWRRWNPDEEVIT